MAGEAENGDERDDERSRRSPQRRPGAVGDSGARSDRTRDQGARSGPRRDGDAARRGRPGDGGGQTRGADRSGTGGRGYGDRRPSRTGGVDPRGGRQPESGRGYRGDRPRGTQGRPPVPAGRGPRSESDQRRPLPRGDARPPQADRPFDPPIDEDVTFAELDRQARQRLRTLSKESANRVGRHLVMAGMLVESDPELAYQHAHSAMRRAGRVDVVREAVALTAYATARYAEALREIRTVRRLSGLDALRAIEADCERGLGRPERALDLAAAPASKDMTDTDRVELAIVASGARLDLDQPQAALLVLDQPLVLAVTDEAMKIRVAHARVTALRAADRGEEADALEATIPDPMPEEEDVAFDELDVAAAPAVDANPGDGPRRPIRDREDEPNDG